MRVIRHGDAAPDRTAYAQLDASERKTRIHELALGLRERIRSANEKVGPKAFPFDAVSDVLAQLVEPAIDDNRDGSVVEEMSVATHLQLDSALRRRRARRVDPAHPMQALVFLAAIGFSETSASRQDEQRPRAIAWNSVCCDLDGLESLAGQTLDRIAPHRIERA